MSKVSISGNPSGTGTFTIASPNSNTDRTLTLPDNTGTVVTDSAAQTLTNKTLGSGLVMAASTLTSGTAVASTSGTAIDFTGIPSWVRRITVMFTGVSTNGTSSPMIQIGSGSVETSGYLGSGVNLDTVVSSALLTTGYRIGAGTNASVVLHGLAVIQLITASTWGMSASFARSDSAGMFLGAGSKAITGTLDRVRITTVNGTDTFDAGTINIMWE